ncbi:hypothetical protein [Priestia megaterium]|uniref:hypothetical protein n=1 Tax=Priestia megaterium TaxID=1404 RepID=UPI001127ABDE|nr:hypothetical protein [Priestia megaterium]TPF14218.1 hypothetical protein CBE78_26270 [Priestia megaterium]TPF19413.1 hypothetical protein CBE79_27290 [Priestia megaterium]
MIIIKLRDYNKYYHQYGDIILTKSTGKLSAINTGVQSIVTNNKATYTHALLCLNRGTFVEATMGSELLAFHYTNKDRTSLDSEEWKVIRYKHMKLEHHELLTQSVYFHLGKKYSLKNQDAKSFCSSFIAMVYNSLFEGLFKYPNSTLPVHLEQLPFKDAANWEDVTEEYTTKVDFTIQNENMIIIDNTDIINSTTKHTKDAVFQLEAFDEYIEFIENHFN